MTILPRSVDLRPFRAADADQVYAAIQESLNELPLWMPELNAGLTAEAIREWIEEDTIARAEKKAYNFAIVDPHGDRILGGCGLTQIHHRHRFANLYYWVRTNNTGRGVASRAVPLLAKFGFEMLGLQRIEIVVAVDNHASQRVAEKVGATREGRLRNRLFVDDTLQEAFMYSLVPENIHPGETGIPLNSERRPLERDPAKPFVKNTHCTFCGWMLPAGQAWPKTCTRCGNTTFLSPAPVVVLLVPVDGGVLAIRRGIRPRKGWLALPGGFIDLGETWQEAAAREVREEANLVISPGEIRLVGIHNGSNDTLVIFGISKPKKWSDLLPFKPCLESSERVILTEPQELAFPLHTEMVRRIFANDLEP